MAGERLSGGHRYEIRCRPDISLFARVIYQGWTRVQTWRNQLYSSLIVPGDQLEVEGQTLTIRAVEDYPHCYSEIYVDTP
jgi:hypothetical protein